MSTSEFVTPKQHVIDRFWSKVDKSAPGGCWVFTGNHSDKGYGQVSWTGAKYAHRAVWMLVNGPIPPGLSVLHHCDNPPCVNPDHLWLGTYADNNRDCTTKGRRAKGEAHGRAKLTEAQVRTIREEYKAGRRSQTDLARMFGISLSNTNEIIHLKKWTHIP